MAALPDEIQVKVVLDEESVDNLSEELLDRLATLLAPRILAIITRRSSAR